MQRITRSAVRVTQPITRQLTRSVTPAIAAAAVSAQPIGTRSYATRTVTDSSTTIAFLEAAKHGDIRMVHQHINNKADVNAGDYDKRTPLHVAAAEGQLEVVNLLLEAGADVNVEDRWGWTPLNEAVFGKHDKVISALRAKGGKIGQSRLSEIVSLMCQAAAEGNVQQLQRLYDAGVDMNLSDYDLRTPLHVAASDGHLATVDFLIKHGARVNVVDRFGNTPLGDASRASAKSKKNVVQLLVSHGGAIEAEWDIGRDPLLSASVQRSLQFLVTRVGAAYIECYMPGEETADFSTNEAMQYCAKEYSSRLNAFLTAPQEAIYPNSTNNLLGRVWQQKQPTTFDLTEKDMPNRFKEAKAAGLKYGMIVPLKNGEKQFGLLKLYSFEPLNTVKLDEFTRFASGLVSAGLYKKGKPQTVTFAVAAEHPEISNAAMQEVYERIVAEEVFNANLVYSEVDYFFGLGLQKYYFERFTPAEIANHIHSFIAAKKLAATTGKPEEIMLNIESAGPDGVPDKVLCMCPAEHSKMVEVEKIIQGHIAKVPKDRAYTLEFFMSHKPLLPGGKKQLGLYVLETSNWINPAKLGSTDPTITETASQKFMKTKTKAIKERYQQIMTAAVAKISPFAEIFPVYRDGTIPLMFAFFQGAGTTTSYVLQLTELLKHNNLIAHRKFVETFANGIIVFSLYLQPVPQPRLEQLLQQFSMLHLVPESLLTPRFLSGHFSAEQYTYASAATRFVYYFLNKRSEEFDVLAKSLKNDPLNLGRLRLLQTRLKREAISHDRIAASITNHQSLVADLYSDFHRVATTPRPQNASNDYVVNSTIAQRIKNEAQSLLDGQVLSALLVFNAHMLKTNFYNKSKAALSFRLDPKFLADSDLPQVPFGLFFVMGSDFQGFHLRFRDVARGGIRVIRSGDRQAYNANLETLFAENFGLAYTQNKKNKDIPEFGSKGTILLNLGNQANPFLAFQKYTSGLLDCIIKSDDIVDNYGKEEILFLGPDEGTADYMEWAARYAAKRGYKFWRSFTTGKPPALGGIPHDKFGMTTRSVHRYVVNCLKKLGLKEENVTKFQTGGPDGDLGSNEILLSKDRTLAMVDGSGVIYDPNGLDRKELTRLAHARSMIKGYDVKKLSPGGFRVLTSDTNVTLPNGEVVASGLVFRNEFHLHPLASADLFVPCGGRPESVNLTNVHRLFDAKGLPRFKIIVEGANLFFTQDARMVLENAGVVLYKDASANKGGVTSSSLEVLAALSLDAEQFEQHMAVKDETKMPTFYKEYVAEIQARIEHDADLEFECIWKEHERTNTHRYLLTDQVSDKINSLNDFVQSSSLWHNLELRNTVLQRAIPKKLTELVGLQTIVKRVPEAYIQAIFGAHLASRYVYKHGLDANEFAFFEFMQDYLKPTAEEKANSRK